MQQISKQPAFELGQIVATPGAFGHAQEGRTTAGRVPHAPCQPRVIVMWNNFWQGILREGWSVWPRQLLRPTGPSRNEGLRRQGRSV